MKGTGTINHEQYFFVAKGLIPSKLPNPDGEEVILNIIALDPRELKAKLMTEELKWSHSTLGLLKLLMTHFPEI
jgi:hypothetical protein